MPLKEIKEHFNKIEDHIENGNYRAAREEIKSISYNELTEDEKKRYSQLLEPIKLDKIYFLIALGVFSIIITYFILVK